jgi:anti-sigma factor RsiW
MINSDPWTDRLSEYLDEELAPSERAALERHLATCPACTQTLSDLRSVLARARALDDRAPRHDLWPAIAAMVGPGQAVVTPIGSDRRRFSFSAPQLAAAAVLIMLGSGGLAWVLRGPASPAVGAVAAAPAALPAPPASASVRAVRNPFETRQPTAQQSYDAAVADLQQVLAEGRGRLDTTTVRVIQKNLAAIDSAVAQARRAVQKDPANGYLNSYLAHTMRRKIDLLRQVAALTAAQS